MKAFLITLSAMFFVANLFSQIPELITDFNTGPDDSFIGSYGGTLDDAILLPILTGDMGEELAVVKDGELSFLKDINPGSESSKPRS